MKKKLLAAAVAATMAVPAASFAAGPTIYGHAHHSIDYLNNDSRSSVNASSNSSRFGVKGSFDLGGELAAIYLVEWEINLTDTDAGGDQNPGGSDFRSRNRYAGFKHDSYGTLILGRHDTPMKVIGRKVDLFWSTQLGQNRNIVTNPDSSIINRLTGDEVGPSNDSAVGWDARLDNVLAYISPNWGPVNLFVAYSFDHNFANANRSFYPMQDDNNFDALSIAGIYDQKNVFTGDDNLFFGVAWETHNVKEIDLINAAGQRTTSKDSENALRVSIKYSWGNWTLTGMFQQANDQNFISDRDRKAFGGGIAYKMGKNTFKGQFYGNDELDDHNLPESQGGTRVLGSDSGAFNWAVGWDYAFSKNVQPYLQVTGLSNDENSRQTLGGRGHGATAKGTRDEMTFGLSAGMRIKF